MPTFVRLVVRGHALKDLLCLPRLLTMQRLLNVSKSLMMCSKPSLTKDGSPPLSESFWISWLPYLPPRDISSCTSEEIVKILISKNKSGKTVLHSQSCSEVPCNCPTRFAAGSVDCLLGKLRAIFNNLGRLHDSNPVAHTRVKEYLKFIREEQAGKAILPSQADPLFFVKFSKLIAFLRRSIEASAHLSVVDKYILVRDATFFVVDSFTGDRASDLGRLLANQVFRLKDRKGFFT